MSVINMLQYISWVGKNYPQLHLLLEKNIKHVAPTNVKMMRVDNDAQVSNNGQDQYGLSTGLYDTISARPEVDSGHNCLDHSLEKLETEFISTIAHLHQGHINHPPMQPRTCYVPTCTGQGPRLVTSSIGQDRSVGYNLHYWLHCKYADPPRSLPKEVPRQRLDQIYKDTNTLVDRIEHLCSNSKTQFLKSWIRTHNIPVRLLAKDHKPLQANEWYPTRLIISAHSFTQCLSNLASKIERIFCCAGINFEQFTIKNFLDINNGLRANNSWWRM